MTLIIELGGGLGNQMLEYAAAFMLAKKNGVQLKVDPSYLTAWHIKKTRDPELLKLGLSSETCTKKELRRFLFKTQIKYFDMILRRRGLFQKKVYDETKGATLENMANIKEGYLRGYFFNLKTFDIEEMRKIFKKEFELKDKKNIKKELKDILSSNSVSVHIRRGDLLRVEGGHVLSKDYYRNAIDHVCKTTKNPVFYFFSDDIGWCRENFSDLKDCFFVGGKSVVEDFELMKTCKKNILANSTLSWWVGYLNYNKNKKIIAPQHFGSFESDKREDLILEGWTLFEG
jgi:hypothetical protein